MEDNEDNELKLKRDAGSKKLPMLGSLLTPEIIVGKMFSFYMKAHLWHWNSNTIGKHLLLDELYPKLVSLNDEISEYLLGLQIPKRFDEAAVAKAITAPGKFSDSALLAFTNEGFEFTKSLCDYAEERELEELCNLSSELQQAFNKARLFITYE